MIMTLQFALKYKSLIFVLYFKNLLRTKTLNTSKQKLGNGLLGQLNLTQWCTGRS